MKEVYVLTIEGSVIGVANDYDAAIRAAKRHMKDHNLVQEADWDSYYGPVADWSKVKTASHESDNE